MLLIVAGVQGAVLSEFHCQTVTKAIKLMEWTVDVILRGTEDASGNLDVEVNLVWMITTEIKLR